MNELDVILLVDDNPTNLQVLYQTLQGMDYKILIAKSGKDAISLAEKSQPVLILLDIMMPNMDGYEVLKKLKSKENTKNSAVIFLSALDETKNKVKGLSLGAVDYISKPFQSSEVIARVKTHIKIRHLEQKLEQKNLKLKTDKTQILQSMREGLIELSSDGEVYYANPAALEITGWNKEDLIGSDFHTQIQHSNKEGIKKSPIDSTIYRVLRERESFQSDSECFWHKKGVCFPTEYSLTPLEKTSFLVFKDISERKKNELKLTNALNSVSKLKEKLVEENIYLQHELDTEKNFSGIIGNSPALLKVLKQLEKVANTDTTVLIQGESGTGKEAIARAIHDLSDRHKHPLIKVNCGAISESLVESELFGHVKGAFTSAVNDRKGHFELADGGSIFLDEIGELSLDIQVKLLRAIQEQEIQAVGSQHVTKVDVRIIAATNRDLNDMVNEKLFRMDLYYRLNVFPLLIPPLRDREGDLSLLIDYFLNVFAKKLNKKLTKISKESMDLLHDYLWPGNIRELQNVLERAAILANNSIIEIDDAMLPNLSTNFSTNALNTEQLHENSTLMTLAENERLFISNILEQVDWVIGGKKGAAEILGLPVSTLRSRMKKLGILK